VTGSYNGYTGRQRDKIVTAYRKLTGKHAPFEGEPCGMCGDPERPHQGWHSEDYSEPFVFEPPASYPICEPCHKRLHRRFNSLPGEWELFCRHLEAGGYGKEFVELRSVAERRILCDRIAAGAHLSLPRIRNSEPGPYWWRALTLDPESLHAPWARPRPLRARPDEAAFRRAFADARMSDREINLLWTHANAPRRTATMRMLAREALSSDSYRTANQVYGGLTKRLTSLLGWEPDRREDGSPFWVSLIAEGWNPPGREFELIMVPSAAAAVATLANRSRRLEGVRKKG
jgi:hypothetical protein